MSEPCNYSSHYYPICTGELLFPENLSPDTPKILLIHGGAWSSMERGSFAGVADFFRENGFITFNIDYRLTSTDPWPACGDDCLEAARFLIDGKSEELKQWAGRPIFVCGGSAGGHLALMTGLRLPKEQVSGIISISGIADPAEDSRLNPSRYVSLFNGNPMDEKAFPGAWLTPDSPPILLTHYLYDTVVPMESSAIFAQQGTRLGCSMETYFYDMHRNNQGHAMWIPESKPHRLYPDLEEVCLRFTHRILNQPEALPNGN